jgi:pimeloyl-ACP methyl ester carboxylesterase
MNTLALERCVIAGALALGLAAGCAPHSSELEDAPPNEVAAIGQALATVEFNGVHRNAMPWELTGCDDSPQGFDRYYYGREPATAGEYPLFVYLIGMGADGPEGHKFITAMTAVERAAERGFVAATVGYTNGFADGLSCASMSDKARCMFDPNRSNGAIKQICDRTKADCNQGIVVMGHSLGGGVAILARNFDARVRAVVSIGTEATGAACLEHDQRSLPQNRHYALLGEADLFNFGPAELNIMTGLSCPATATSCSVAPGAAMPSAGWYIVQHEQVQDGFAGHCHMLNGNIVSGSMTSDNCVANDVDDNWEFSTTQPWTLDPMLDWLAGFVD